jgi:sigma-B regulation protein RsbU (phosphoserine phosphatase)
MVALIESVGLFSVFRQNQEISIQLQMAREIQKKALPEEIPQNPFFHCQAIIKMANEVGGDFYDFFSFPDGRLGVLIADVSGKNVPAALLTMALKSALHSLPVLAMTPKGLVDRLNEVLLAIVAGEHFVTLVYLLLDPGKAELILSNAGHVPVLHLVQNREGDDVWRELAFADFPLGLFPHSFSQQTIPFSPGDRIILYTDGVTDCQNGAGLRLAETGFRTLLNKNARSPLEDILIAIDDYRGSVPLPDDVTLLSVSFNPTSS